MLVSRTAGKPVNQKARELKRQRAGEPERQIPKSQRAREESRNPRAKDQENGQKTKQTVRETHSKRSFCRPLNRSFRDPGNGHIDPL